MTVRTIGILASLTVRTCLRTQNYPTRLGRHRTRMRIRTSLIGAPNAEFTDLDGRRLVWERSFVH